MKTETILLTSFLAAGMFFGVASPAVHAVLVYEGFDYMVGTPLAGKTGGTGFDTTNGWSSSANGTATIVTGLSFGSLTTTGGAVQFVSDLGSTKAPRSTRQFDLASTAPSDLWFSFLYRIDEFGTVGNSASGARVGVIADGSTSTNEFYARPGYGGNGAPNSATTFAGGVRSDGSADFAQAEGTIYMAVMQFTNVGAANTGGNIWSLDAGSFDDFISAGQNVAALNANSITTAALPAFAAGASLTNDDLLSLLINSGNSADSQSTYTFDEIRYGTDVVSVTPVPEPASLALLGLGGLLIARRQRSA